METTSNRRYFGPRQKGALFQCPQLAPENKKSSKNAFFLCPNNQAILFKSQNPHPYLIFDARVRFVIWAKVTPRAKVSPFYGICMPASLFVY